MSDLELQTPAQDRFANDVLAWGRSRPLPPPGLVATMRASLEGAVARWRAPLLAAAASRPGGRLSIGRKVLERRVCDGWQLSPVRFTHSLASVRATLARDAIALDWQGARQVRTDVLVERVWHDAATRSAGDPSSRSAWMNRRSAEEANELRSQVAGLVDDLREVWPPLPSPAVVSTVGKAVEVPFGGGLVTLFGVPDLIVDSPVHDDRARSLVIDVRTGRPRPDRDREALRFLALLVALARDRPPFRWVSYHVTEGRSECEDLTAEALERVTASVVEVVEQLARTADERPRSLVAGVWCTDCRELATCEVAHRAQQGDGVRAAARDVSHPSAIIEP